MMLFYVTTVLPFFFSPSSPLVGYGALDAPFASLFLREGDREAMEGFLFSQNISFFFSRPALRRGAY